MKISAFSPNYGKIEERELIDSNTLRVRKIKQKKAGASCLQSEISVLYYAELMTFRTAGQMETGKTFHAVGMEFNII